MSFEFKLPELGEGVEAGDVVQILVAKGDAVEAEQNVIELETNKATVELAAPVSGQIIDIHVKEGDSIPVGSLLITIEEAEGAAVPEPAEREEDTEEVPQKAAPTTPPKKQEETPITYDRNTVIPAGPATRRKARERGIDLTKIMGTGANGRITTDDVFRFLLELQGGGATGPVVPPLPDFSKWGDVQTEPYKSLRKKTAEHVTLAWQTIPHVTQFDKSDVTDVEAFRKNISETDQVGGVKITPTVFIMKAVVAALQKFPQFNASLDVANEQIVLKDYIHLGVAVNTDKGLMVPVIRDVDQKDIVTLSKELADMAERARSGKIKIDELQGGTFTISNLGGVAGTGFTPIINHPEVAILGVARMSKEPVWMDEQFVPRSVLPLSVSYDHRVIDGVQGAQFLQAVTQYLEDEQQFGAGL